MKTTFVGKCLLLEEQDERVLVIGDLHLGYEEALNKSGVFVTKTMYREMMNEIEEVLNVINKMKKKVIVDKIILLGDVKHEFSGNLRQEWNDILKMIEKLKEKCGELIILRGNHDNYLINIVKKGEIEVVKSYLWNGVVFVHGDVDYPEMHDKNIERWIMGHAHPAVSITDGTKVERYKCFLCGDYEGMEVIIVPSFFSLVTGSDVKEWSEKERIWLPWDFEYEKFKVKVVQGMEVLDFGILKHIR